MAGQVTLKTASGGTLTVTPADTAGTPILTFPAETGNLISTGTTTRAIPKAAMPTGAILQVVSITKTDVASTTSQTWADISGLSVSITPSSVSSKILVIYNFHGANDNGGGFVKLVRNSTDIAVGTAATGNQINVTVGNYYNTDTNTTVDMGGSYLDSPASSSSVTYKAQFRVGTTGGTLVINRNVSNGNFAYTGVGTSTITLMEVAV